MVVQTDSTQVITQPKVIYEAKPSLKRWLKNSFFLTTTKKYFSKQDQQEIAEAVTQAEHGHIGEIQVVIESCLPSRLAYRQDTLVRARQLFAELGIWDTEQNSGVLLYLNLCERKVEIVIDRGIKQATEQAVWDQICEQILQNLKQEKYCLGIVEGVQEIGIILDQFYAGQYVDLENELSNKPIIL